jgi:hypothetical protein
VEKDGEGPEMRYCIYQTDARYPGYAWERVSTIQQKRRRVVDDATTFLDYLLFVPFESGESFSFYG